MGEEEPFPCLVPLLTLGLPAHLCPPPLPSLEDWQEPQESCGSLCWRGLELGLEAGAAQASVQSGQGRLSVQARHLIILMCLWAPG